VFKFVFNNKLKKLIRTRRHHRKEKKIKARLLVDKTLKEELKTNQFNKKR
jgi:hypothetical protein